MKKSSNPSEQRDQAQQPADKEVIGTLRAEHLRAALVELVDLTIRLELERTEFQDQHPELRDEVGRNGLTFNDIANTTRSEPRIRDAAQRILTVRNARGRLSKYARYVGFAGFVVEQAQDMPSTEEELRRWIGRTLTRWEIPAKKEQIKAISAGLGPLLKTKRRLTISNVLAILAEELEGVDAKTLRNTHRALSGGENIKSALKTPAHVLGAIHDDRIQASAAIQYFMEVYEVPHPIREAVRTAWSEEARRRMKKS